jgi:cytochrome c peroxidase
MQINVRSDSMTTPFVTGFAAAAAVLAGMAIGCAPSGDTTPRGEVVEVEVIETAPPAADPARTAPVAEEADAVAKKADAAKAEADAAIEEAGKSIKEPAMKEPATAEETEAKTDTKTETDAKADAKAETEAEVKAEASPEKAVAAPREPVQLGHPSLTAGVPGDGPITLEQVDAWLGDPKNFVELEPILPLGLSQGAGQITGLEENPLTRAKIELGRQLYFDPRLSLDSTVSCATCHDPSMGYSAHTKTGVGIAGQEGGRNSPAAYNRILSGPQFWDGRADSLEAQAVGPIANPSEMGFTHEGVVKRLGENPVYTKQFEMVFGELTIDRVGQAIAAFERALVTAPSPYDYYEQLRTFEGLDEEDIAEDPDLAAKHAETVAFLEKNPMSEAAKRGRDLFFTEKGNCTACHVGANLADEKYHNLGVGMNKENPDLGRFVVTKDLKDTGAFKTPTIRNVALTAPYMHDGSQGTLEEVVEWYDKGGHPNPHLSDKIRPLNLTAQDKADLVEFMKACTGPTPTVETSRLPE